MFFHDRELEADFQRSYFQTNLQLGRVCHVLAMFFYITIGLWHALVVSPERQPAWAWVMPAVCLMFLAGFAFSYLNRDFYGRIWQPLFAIYVLMTGLGFAIVTVSKGDMVNAYNFVGIIFCLWFCYALIRLTFVWAAVSGTLIVAIYLVGTSVLTDMSERLVLSETFYLMGVNVLGMIVCYALEKLARRDYVLNLMLRNAERETRSLNVELEQRVQARVEELRQMEMHLVQAQKMESVGRLAGGVAHDYNNISSVILGYSELALDTLQPDDPLYEHVDQIQKATIRAAEITQQLLAFARKQTVAPKVLDLNVAVDNTFKMLGRLIGEDIDLHWSPGTDLHPIHIDPAQVDQLLANLCVNARDAITSVGKITIETGNAVFDADYCAEHTGFREGRYAMLAVSDDGAGIAQEHQAKIFEPFFTTKALGAGTGLGLATVYGIVKQNDGFVNVYSEVGVGTTFRIYLPWCEAEIKQDDVAPSADPAPAGRETVLLVEDEAAIRELGVRQLEGLGYTVVAAESPMQAIAAVEDGSVRPDLLLTDVVMPQMNGRDLAERIGEILPDVRILFMSGYTSNVIAHHGVLEQGVQFLAKPFSKRELGVKVRGVLEGVSAKR